jgi:hypothetical protein
MSSVGLIFSCGSGQGESLRRIAAITELAQSEAMNEGPCHHGMARPQVADGGTASYMEGSCE